MRCTNRFCRCICTVIGIALLFMTGCGQDIASLDVPYDVYGSSRTFGIASAPSLESPLYFSDGLCVSEDVSIGIESTDSHLVAGAGAFNLATESVVYAKNIYERLYPASTTKILTAYIALNYCDDLDAYVTVSENAVNLEPDSSVCGLKAGDVIRVRDLLYGMLLPSGNDAAIAVAEYIAGDVKSFVDIMNREAHTLGATRSHFTNPNGMPDENHYSTIYDMYLLFAKALENETFLEMIGTASYDVSYTNATGEAVERTWRNTNQYLTGNIRIPEGFTIAGGKTGTTDDAGYCLVLYSYNTLGQPIISVIFKADTRSDLYLLMNQILEGYA